MKLLLMLVPLLFALACGDPAAPNNNNDNTSTLLNSNDANQRVLAELKTLRNAVTTLTKSTNEATSAECYAINLAPQLVGDLLEGGAELAAARLVRDAKEDIDNETDPDETTDEVLVELDEDLSTFICQPSGNPCENLRGPSCTATKISNKAACKLEGTSCKLNVEESALTGFCTALDADTCNPHVCIWAPKASDEVILEVTATDNDITISGTFKNAAKDIWNTAKSKLGLFLSSSYIRNLITGAAKIGLGFACENQNCHLCNPSSDNFCALTAEQCGGK